MGLRLIAVDMDGTCVAGWRLVPQRNLWAFEQACERGIVVVPATGRPLSGYPLAVQRLPGIRYVISSNGARLTDLRTGEELRETLIPARTASAFLRELRGISVWVSVHKDGICLDKNWIPFIHRCLFYHGDFRKGRRIRRLEDWLERQPGGVEKLQIFFQTKTAYRRTRELLKKWPQLSSCAFHRHYAEITAEGATKGAALQALCERLQIAPAEVMAIGDSDNDLSMLSYAGCAVAMGNANAAVKQAADEITADHKHCGVAWAIGKRLREDAQEGPDKHDKRMNE